MLQAAAVSASLVFSGTGTAYHSCDGASSITAAGTTARVGIVANNSLPLGTWVEMKRPRTVMGRRWFKVMDRGGGGFALDFWAPSCGWMGAWGRRPVSFRALKRSELFRGKPVGGWRVVAARRGGRLSWKPY